MPGPFVSFIERDKQVQKRVHRDKNQRICEVAAMHPDFRGFSSMGIHDVIHKSKLKDGSEVRKHITVHLKNHNQINEGNYQVAHIDVDEETEVYDGSVDVRILHYKVPNDSYL
jgi:hypothetical protein